MIDPRARARATAIVAAVIGLAVATAVIGYFNFGAVLAAMRPIGVPGFLAVIAAQLCLFVPLGLAWRLAASGENLRTPAFVWGRLTREAAAGCRPEGRPLYAGHAALDWPDAPHLVMWHALSLLREHRGDGAAEDEERKGDGRVDHHV